MDKEFILASAPLKVILFGEHAVMHESPCIAFAINKRATAKIIPNGVGKIFVVDPISGPIRFDTEMGMGMLTTDLEILLPMPIGCGLGTSASFSLLASAAIIADQFDYAKSLHNFKNKSQGEQIFSLANSTENVLHGNTSGVDIATVYNGGMIYFTKKNTEKISTKFKKRFKILIFNSGIKKNTKDAVNKVANVSKNDIFSKIAEIVKEAKTLLSLDFRIEEMYDLIRRNQECLEKLGIVPEPMKQEVERLRKMGIESKITGGGFGGCLVTIVEKDVEISGWEEVKITNVGLKYRF